MKQFKTTIKEAIEKWNKKNPEKKQKTLVSVADEIGTSSQVLSQLGSRFSKNFNKHCDVIFMSENKDEINVTWKMYLNQKVKIFEKLENIRIILECEISDLITKI